MPRRLPPLPSIPKVPINLGGDVPSRLGQEDFDVESSRIVETNLLLLAEGARIAAQYEMGRLLQEVLIDSQDNYVPIDTGDLRESGDCDTYDPSSSQTTASGRTLAEVMEMAVWYAGSLGPVGTLGVRGTFTSRFNTESTTHAGHRMGSRTRRNIRTYGPEHLGFHLQSPQFKEWYNRAPPQYAVDQHENRSYHHGLNWSGSGPGQAKYLERPFNKKAPEVAPRLQAAINSAWTGVPGSWTGD